MLPSCAAHALSRVGSCRRKSGGGRDGKHRDAKECGVDVTSTARICTYIQSIAGTNIRCITHLSIHCVDLGLCYSESSSYRGLHETLFGCWINSSTSGVMACSCYRYGHMYIYLVYLCSSAPVITSLSSSWRSHQAYSAASYHCKIPKVS